MIYLDNNATTKVDEKVLEEMLPYLQNEYANPSSMYDFAKKPAAAIKEARAKIRDFLGDGGRYGHDCGDGDGFLYQLIGRDRPGAKGVVRYASPVCFDHGSARLYRHSQDALPTN